MELYRSSEKSRSGHEQSDSNEQTPIIVVENITPVHSIGGISVISAVTFIIGELIGVGALSLPNSLNRSGWTGVITLVWSGAVATYNGFLLADCWLIVVQRHKELRGHVRYPYPAIGEKAVGRWMWYVTLIGLIGSCVGTFILFILLAAENLHFIVAQAGFELNFCIWMVVVATVLTPMTWFGSPKDFGWIGILAMVAALTGLLLLFINLMIILPPSKTVTYNFPSTAKPYFLAFGTVFFSYSGASTFPTIQNDMREPKKFKYAVLIAYLIGGGLYTTIAVSGYYKFGQYTATNITYNLPNGGLRITIEVLYILHIVFANIIFINPVTQALDEALRIPLTKTIKNWRRILFRTAFVGLMLFLAESVPHFGALLSLVGGTCNAFMTFIAPNIFYLALCKNGYLDGEGIRRQLSLFTWIINIIVICIGITMAAISTYGSILELVLPNSFVPPCYVNATEAQAVYAIHRGSR